MQESLDINLCLGAHSIQNSQACGALKQSTRQAARRQPSFGLVLCFSAPAACSSWTSLPPQQSLLSRIFSCTGSYLLQSAGYVICTGLFAQFEYLLHSRMSRHIGLPLGPELAPHAPCISSDRSEDSLLMGKEHHATPHTRHTWNRARSAWRRSSHAPGNDKERPLQASAAPFMVTRPGARSTPVRTRKAVCQPSAGDPTPA